MNAALLARLRDARGAFLPWAELGDDSHLVGQEIGQIADFGHVLERHPYLGVAYRGPSPRLCPDQIEWELNTRVIGQRLAVWDRVASTNDLAAAAARSRTNEGLVILAEGQTAGRGRRGRSWTAPSGSSLLMSVLLFPTGPLALTSHLMALGAVAVAELVAEVIGREARIKWPNDVKVDGRKVAGILVERGLGSVIGIGLNVNLRAGDFPDDLAETATSLRILTGEFLDRSELARLLIRRLDDLYQTSKADGPEPLNLAWGRLMEPLGRAVTIRATRDIVRGRLISADLVRGLVVQDDGGVMRRIEPSDVQGIDADESEILESGDRTPLFGRPLGC